MPGKPDVSNPSLGLRRRDDPSIVIVPLRSLLAKNTAPPPSLGGRRPQRRGAGPAGPAAGQPSGFWPQRQMTRVSWSMPVPMSGRSVLSPAAAATACSRSRSPSAV